MAGIAGLSSGNAARQMRRRLRTRAVFGSVCADDIDKTRCARKAQRIGAGRYKSVSYTHLTLPTIYSV